MRDRIKIELGLDTLDTSQDNYLDNKISDALVDIKMYVDPSKHDISHIPKEVIDNVTVKLVVLYFNRRGLEGTGYFSEGGLTFSYKDKNEALKDLFDYRKPTLVNVRGEK